MQAPAYGPHSRLAYESAVRVGVPAMLKEVSAISPYRLYVLKWECPPLEVGNASTGLHAPFLIIHGNRNPPLWECPKTWIATLLWVLLHSKLAHPIC